MTMMIIRARLGSPPTERTTMYCEDYPCCGHTPDDPCGRQWYDAPDAFDLTRNPHALCDHAEGWCDVVDPLNPPPPCKLDIMDDAPEWFRNAPYIES